MTKEAFIIFSETCRKCLMEENFDLFKDSQDIEMISFRSEFVISVFLFFNEWTIKNTFELDTKH